MYIFPYSRYISLYLTSSVFQLTILRFHNAPTKVGVNSISSTCNFSPYLAGVFSHSKKFGQCPQLQPQSLRMDFNLSSALASSVSLSAWVMAMAPKLLARKVKKNSLSQSHSQSRSRTQRHRQSWRRSRRRGRHADTETHKCHHCTMQRDRA